MTRDLQEIQGPDRLARLARDRIGLLLVPAAQGRGYATEAGAAALDFARDVLKLRTLVTYLAPDNEPSKRVAEKLGGELDGVVELLSHGRHCVYRYRLTLRPDGS